MFFLRILEDPDGGLDLVQIADEHFRFLLEIEGRRVAVDWLLRQGCCPGAVQMLHDVPYMQTCNIASPVEPPGTGVSRPIPEPPFFQDPPGSPTR